jgi:hypothetical protein
VRVLLVLCAVFNTGILVFESSSDLITVRAVGTQSGLLFGQFASLILEQTHGSV